MENEANLANYSELRNHVNRLSKRIGELPEGELRDDAKADRDDYYERLVQCKEMRVTTLECHLVDQQKEKDKLQRKLEQMTNVQRWLVLFIVSFLFVAIEYSFDNIMTKALSRGCIYVGDRPPLLVFSTSVIVSYVTRKLI